MERRCYASTITSLHSPSYPVTAKCKSEFDFWAISAQFDGAKHVTPWAQTLLSCYSSMIDVEWCHKFTSRHRSQYSNEKVDNTTEVESNKWQQEKDGSHGPTVTDALPVRSHMRADGRQWTSTKRGCCSSNRRGEGCKWPLEQRFLIMILRLVMESTKF